MVDLLVTMSPKDMRWEANFKVDIPEFHGGISSNSLLDWLEDVEEILKFQSVSDDRLVSLVVKKFRGHAASWWQQVKTKRKRDGKNPVKSWDKLKKKLCSTFLPRYYDHAMYNHLRNLQQRARFMGDYEEDWHVQNNNIVDKFVCGIDDDELSTTKPRTYGALIFDVEDDTDLDAYNYQLKDENTSVVVPKFYESVEDVKTTDFVYNVCDPVNDVCDEISVAFIMNNCVREDFIGSKGVDYINFSSQEQAQFINNHEEKNEDTHIDKRNHNNSTYPANRHRQIKSEPPDCGQSGVSFLSGVKDDLNNQIYVDPSFSIYIEEDTSFVVYERHDVKRLIDGGMIKITKPLVILRHCAAIREALHVSYKTTQKNEEIYVCSSKSECMNWYIGKKNPMSVSMSSTEFLIELNEMQLDSLLPYFFVGLLTCLRWKYSMCLIADDTGELCKDHTCREKSYFLVVVGSFEVVLVVCDVSKIRLLNHLQDNVNVEPTTSRASTWVHRAVRKQLLNSNFLSETLNCQSDVTCASRKLLTCEKLSFILVCFFTKLRFLVAKQTIKAVVVVLMWKLLVPSLDIQSSYPTLQVHQQVQQVLAETTYKASIVKRLDVVFDPGDVLWVVFTKCCFPFHTSNNAENDQVLLKVKFKSFCEQWRKVNQENVELIKENMLLKSKMEHIQEKLVYETKESQKLRIKLAETQNCSCALKGKDHNVLIMRLKAALVAEKETSNQLEKELMELKKNVRMLNSGTKNLDQILRMGRTGKAKFGLGYQGVTYGSTTVFVPSNLSTSAKTKEHSDSRPNPLSPDPVHDRYEHLDQIQDKDGDVVDVYNEDGDMIYDRYDEHDDNTCEDPIGDLVYNDENQVGVGVDNDQIQNRVAQVQNDINVVDVQVMRDVKYVVFFKSKKRVQVISKDDKKEEDAFLDIMEKKKSWSSMNNKCPQTISLEGNVEHKKTKVHLVETCVIDGWQTKMLKLKKLKKKNEVNERVLRFEGESSSTRRELMQRIFTSSITT